MTARKRKTYNRRTSKKSNKKRNWSFLKVILLACTIVISIYLIYAVGNDTIHIPTENIFKTNKEKFQYNANELLSVRTDKDIDDIFIRYKAFNVSFNPTYRIPNYVVYELTKSEVEGEQKRANSFECDRNVKGCPEPYEYTRSGYDRGHMAPAADMKWDYDAMHESFYMTNVCPQKHSLNGRGWKSLEEKLRDWVKRDSALIIVSGPILSRSMKTIGKTGIAIPERFFKAVLAPFATPARAIAFIYKNDGGQKYIEDQVVSVDEVEAATSLDFFYTLPDDIENRIEQSTDYKEWNN